MVIIDNFSGHKLEEKQYRELEKVGIFIKYLRPYTTHLCQPLDLNINFILKSKIKNIGWNELRRKLILILLKQTFTIGFIDRGAQLLL